MKWNLRWAVPLSVLFVGFVMQQSSVAASATDQKTVERTFKVTGAVELEVKTNSEDLQVRSGQDGQVLVRCVVKPQNDHDFDDEDVAKAGQYIESNLPVRQEGNRILINHFADREMLRNLGVEYELTVPANTRVSYEAGSGDLIVEGIRGPVDYHSGSGDVQIRSVQDGVRVRTGSGDVSLEDMGKGPIEVDTSSGDVFVRLDSKAGYDVTAHTGSGDFSMAQEITMEAGDTRSEIRGKVRGGGAAVNVRTGSGDIRIE